MNRGTLWLVVVGLVVLSLVASACAPAAPTAPAAPPTTETKQAPVVEETEQVVAEKEVVAGKADTVTLTLTKLDGTKVEKMVEMPKYGGTHTHLGPSSGIQFDNSLSRSPGEQHKMDYSVLLDGDILRGPAGTGETNWDRDNFMGYIGLMRPLLAEGWSIPDETTIIFKIRKDVHFALDPSNDASRLVGGREVTADDVVYSMNRVWDAKTSYHSINHPNERMQSVKALGKYTVEYKLLPDQHGIHLLQAGGRIPIIAHEVVEKYGDLQDWRNSVGSGPVILKDYVPGSALTFARNPNYFEMDPHFPENRLPYVDSVRLLAIPDRSTQLAAFRTGKMDYLTSLSWDESDDLERRNPQIVQRQSWGTHVQLTFNMTKPDLPWAPQDDPNALKVRRALNMAVNKQAILDGYYGGKADLFSAPWPETPDYAGIFRPLETYSQDVQEMFEYNPEKAKQLLKEAGYPNGFKASVVMTSADADFFSIFKADLAKVGVELEFDVKETSVYTNLAYSREYPELIRGWSGTAGMPWKFHELRNNSSWTYSGFKDTVVEETFDEVMLALGKDDAKLRELYARVNDAYLESAQHVWTPRAWRWDAWWPWLKRFEGAHSTGTWRSSTNYQSFNHFIWIDLEMKKKMGF